MEQYLLFASGFIWGFFFAFIVGLFIASAGK